MSEQRAWQTQTKRYAPQFPPAKVPGYFDDVPGTRATGAQTQVGKVALRFALPVAAITDVVLPPSDVRGRDVIRTGRDVVR